MKDPHLIITAPHITERTVTLSYGNEREKDESKLVRKYTFMVALDANKIEIKSAIEAIYNQGKKADQAIKVEKVHTIAVRGKKRRRGRIAGYEPNRKKAIVTLARGQIIEDYGV